MGYILDEITEAAKTTKTPIRLLSIDEADRVRREVVAKFTGGKDVSFLWDHFTDSVYVQSHLGWLWISEFTGAAKTIMFFLDWQEPEMIEFEQGSQISRVLGGSFNFEFYVTNPEVEYILCHNHHDFLVATGTAMSWLLQNEKRISEEAVLNE